MTKLSTLTLVIMCLLLGMSTAVKADDCTPAICAGVSPTCWLAYEKIMVHKDHGIPSEEKCKEFARDAADFGAWLKVQGLDTRTAVCACAAAYWSLEGVSQGLPGWD
jgi:hypothetical protein